MFFPTYIQLQYWYYPTGNTPAVNLIRDMQARDSTNKNLNILSLACGDPRNILFTLWNEGRHSKLLFGLSTSPIEKSPGQSYMDMPLYAHRRVLRRYILP